MPALWIDVFDSSNNLLGEGPVTAVANARVKRNLGGVGSFSATIPGVDKRALDMLTNERRISIYRADETATDNKRLLVQGIIRKRKIASTSKPTLQIQGPDILDELKRRTVLQGRIYRQTSLSSVASGLIALVPNWSVSVDSSVSSQLIDARFDGVSVLQAFQELYQRYGLHLRLSTTNTRTLQIGKFGSDSGLRLQAIDGFSSDIYGNQDIVISQSFEEGLDSEMVFNRLYLQGDGDGSSVLTLEGTTRTTPYTPVKTSNPDGTVQYYIQDATSIASHGIIEKFVKFGEIGALSNSAVDIRNAANALYDAGSAYLARHKDSLSAYKVQLKKVDGTLNVGDKLKIDYRRELEVTDGTVTWINVSGDFWIMEVSEQLSTAGHSVTCMVQNLDRHPDSAARRVQHAIQEVRARDLHPTVSPSIRTYVRDRHINSSNPASFTIEFTDAVRELQRVRMVVRTSRFISTVRSAAASAVISSSSAGIHRHRMFWLYHGNMTGTIAGGEGWSRLQFAAGNDALGGEIHRRFAIRGAGVVLGDLPNNPAEFWTESAAASHSHQIPAHTHPMVYGLYRDTVYPAGLTVKVNGVDKTMELFGVTSVGTSTSQSIVATANSGNFANLLTGASGGLRQAHTIEFGCSSGQGNLEIDVEIFEITQSIALPLPTADIVLS